MKKPAALSRGGAGQGSIAWILLLTGTRRRRPLAA
jgi:hypothetical protein